MNWIINFINDYFHCKECEKYNDREIELRKLIKQLIDTQNELLKYIE